MFFRDENKVRVNNAQISTFIGEDTKVEGTLISSSSVRIDGTIVGGVCAEGTVIVSQSGQIQGNIIAKNIVIAGVVDGNMQIADKTNIEPTGEVYGDISTSRILIDEESVFQGKCNMNKDKESEKKRRKQKKEQSVVKPEGRTESKPAADVAVQGNTAAKSVPPKKAPAKKATVNEKNDEDTTAKSE